MILVTDDIMMTKTEGSCPYILVKGEREIQKRVHIVISATKTMK
jgi:hypothetical protein